MSATTESTAADRHRVRAARFSEVVDGVTDWDVPTPVSEWTARDIVAHLTEWLPGFLSGTGVRLPDGPAAADDPAGAWRSQRDAVQALLDDPATERHTFSDPHSGEMPLTDAIDSFYTPDVFLHTWDLARATGQDDTLDPSTCQAMVAEMEPMDELLRSSGEFGPRVPVADDASIQDRLIAFIGRDPGWRPARREDGED